jgi:Fe-S-cluster-containing dehydrogenase component
VMEKCTYCIQRIEAVKIVAKNQKRPIRDGEIVTACAQACPAGAISFGDIKPPSEPGVEKSVVLKDHENKRCYSMLEELNVRPRTRYLARVRNPHPALTTEAAHS